MFSAIKGLFLDDLGYDILADIQEKVGKGIYYIEEYYYEGEDEGEVEHIDGIGVDDLGVERHLKPLHGMSGYNVTKFEGKVTIKVSLINTKGERSVFKLPYDVEYENEQENIEFAEYFGEFVTESEHQLREEMRGKWLESDEGDFIEHVEIPKGLENLQVFTLDKEVFLNAIRGKKDKEFVVFTELEKEGLKSLMKELITLGGRTVIERFRVGYKGTNTFDRTINFVHLTYIFDVRVNNTVRTIKRDKLLYVEDLKFNENKVLELYKRINTELNTKKVVGLITPLKEGKYTLSMLNIDNRSDLNKLFKLEGQYTRQVGIVYGKETYNYLTDKGNTNESIYITRQTVKYENDEWVKEIKNRFDKAVKETKSLASIYDKSNHCYLIKGSGGREVIAGTHYALLRTKDGYRVIYNLKEERLSIKEVKDKIGTKGEINVKLQLVLNLIDGRRKVSKKKIEEVMGV